MEEEELHRPPHHHCVGDKDDGIVGDRIESESVKNLAVTTAVPLGYDTTETDCDHSSSSNNNINNSKNTKVDDDGNVVIAVVDDDDVDHPPAEPTTAILDACLRDLTRRRMQQAMAQERQQQPTSFGQDEQQQPAAAMSTGGEGEQHGMRSTMAVADGGGQSSAFSTSAALLAAEQHLDIGEEPSNISSNSSQSSRLLRQQQNLLNQMLMLNNNGTPSRVIMNGNGGIEGLLGGRGPGRGGVGDSSNTSSSTSGLADYVGPTADSFAQAFVDRWASSHSANTLPSSAAPSQPLLVPHPPRRDNIYHRTSSSTTTTSSLEEGNKRYRGYDSSVTAPSSGQRGGSDSGGTSYPNKLWWVCDYCQNKAFMSRDELHEHVLCCELNPTPRGGGASARSGSGSSRLEKSGEIIMVPSSSTNNNFYCSTGSRMTGNAWNTGGGGVGLGGGQFSSSLSSMHPFGPLVRSAATGSINSSASAAHHSLGDYSSILHPAMAGHHHTQQQQQQQYHAMGSRAAAATALQNAWLSTSVNPYNMGTICNDASMAMNPHNILYGVGAGAGISYAKPLPDSMVSMANINPNTTDRMSVAPQKKNVPPINPELLEASKGPFRQLIKPIALALDEDKHWITPLHCFVRKHCVEVFTASETDVQTPSKGKRKPIQVGQIGIRCVHCHEGLKKTDLNRERGSVYYPTSLSSIYNATMNLLQRHLRTCSKVPISVMEKYKQLKDEDARSGTSKAYWIESARSLGFVDTLHGIKLSAKEPPPPPSTSASQNQTKEAMGCGEQMIRTESNLRESKEDSGLDDGVDAAKENDEGTKESEDEMKDSTEDDVVATKNSESDNSKSKEQEEEEQSIADPSSLVDPSDKDTATAFSYLLLKQMRACVFTEADRLGKRKGLPPGFAGLACKHCFGGYGSGRYFPSSIKTISDTSKTLNVLHNHMTRCRRVPKDVLDQLETARAKHDDERCKKKFGSQKAFFAKVWSRLHGNRPDGVVVKPPSRKTSKSTSNDGLRRLSSTQSANSFGSCQSEVMPIHRFGASGMGTNDVVKPSQATMSAHDMAMALVIGGGTGNCTGGIPHSTMHYPFILGGGLDPKVMTWMDKGHPTGILSMAEGLPTHVIGGAGGSGASLSMGGSNNESLVSFQHIPKQPSGNGVNEDNKRSLDTMLSSESQEMSQKKLRLSSSTNIADV